MAGMDWYRYRGTTGATSCRVWWMCEKREELDGVCASGALGMESSCHGGMRCCGQNWLRMSYKYRDNFACMNCTGIDAGVSGDGLRRRCLVL